MALRIPWGSPGSPRDDLGSQGYPPVYLAGVPKPYGYPKDTLVLLGDDLMEIIYLRNTVPKGYPSLPWRWPYGYPGEARRGTPGTPLGYT